MNLHPMTAVRPFVALALLLTVCASAQGLDYPPLYRSLALPELPMATLTSTGRQSTSLRDGLSIRLSTPTAVGDVRGFYADALSKTGWTVAPSRPLPPGLPAAGVQATKDRLHFSATITAQGSATQVDLAVVEQ
jgi:hypothetical protein